MGESAEERSGAEYLAQLLKDKKQIQAFPNVFIHLERLLDDEINKVRVTLFNLEKIPLALPDEDGQPKITLTEKLFVPVKEHPDFNFVGRILGPRGITAKQLERDTGCKIMVRGKGSMRDRKKEDQMKGKPNWEHLSEELHVLVVVEDTQRRAEVKMSRAVDEIRRLLIPAPEGEDELKRKQLMELAIMNGTYRDTKTGQPGPNTQSCVSPASSISPARPAGVPPNAPAALAAAVAQLQSRVMGHPILPSAQFPGLNIAALQNQLLRAPMPGTLQGSLQGAHGAGQYLLQHRMQGVPTSQPPGVMQGMPPGLASGAESAQSQANAMYSQANAMLYTQALQGGTTVAAQGATDYSQHYGLVSPTLLDYQSLDPSAAGAIPKVRRAPVPATAGHPYHRV